MEENENSKSKGVAAMLVSKMEPKEGDHEEAGEEEGLDAATDDVMAAITAGDPQALKMALKSFMELC